MVGEEFLAVVEATERRYEQREPERAETSRVLRERGVLYADTPARVTARLRRLNVDWSLARALEQTPAITSSSRSLAEAVSPELFGADLLGLERLMGRNDLIDIGFLEAGVVAGRSVGRITVRGSGKRGTGFLVSPRLLMTNNHVLRDGDEAGRAFVEFNFQDGLDGMPLAPVAFALEPESFFVTDRALDFSVVAVAERGAGEAPLSQFGWLRLIEAEGKVVLGELVNIIQHPNGEPKQLALRENEVVDLLERFVHYRTDTAPGSSGSPVFNDRWEVVALHHSGVPRRDEHGNLLAVDGSLWTEDMGEERLAWIANEGARISRVLRALREQPLAGADANLLAELAQAPAVAALTGAGPRTSAAAAPPLPGTELLAGGAARFTLPLQVTVSLGATTIPVAAGSAAPPVPAATTVAPQDPRLRTALVNLEASRARPYYDEQADAEARTRYYEPIDSDSDDGPALLRAVSELMTATHEPRQPYEPMQLVYPWVDQHHDRRLRSIYSGRIVDPEDFIREDAQIALERSARLQELAVTETAAVPGAFEAELDLLEATLPFNCEHVVPQSWFSKRQPMRGDLHHLFACESRCNSFRGNIPYHDFTDPEEVVQSDCGRREPEGFEPIAGKGPIARATLYFLLRYPGQIGDEARELQGERLALLLTWHEADPVGVYERHRNAAIAELQGNRNPLIDHPHWARRLPLTAAFGR
jgi:endonuclease G